jgi:hypothetical protein
MLIFLEGVCVSNNDVLVFQKGVFDLNVKIIPVAIKYNKKFSEPYWNRRLHGFFTHFLYLLTRWKTVVDVYWMEGEMRNKKETSAEFSFRIKSLISKKVNINNSLWTGAFKNNSLLHQRELLRRCFIEKYLETILKPKNKDHKYLQNFNNKLKKIILYFLIDLHTHSL